jgi:hypothetical protein
MSRDLGSCRGNSESSEIIVCREDSRVQMPQSFQDTFVEAMTMMEFAREIKVSNVKIIPLYAVMTRGVGIA